MGGGGKSAKEPQSSKDLAAMAKQIFEESTPMRLEGLSNLMDVLQTGGTMSKIPGIGSAVEQSKAQMSDVLKQTETGLAQTGMEGTPFGQMIMANTKQQGGQAIGLLPEQLRQQYANQYMSLIPLFLGQQQPAQMLSQSANTQAQMQQINAQNNAAFMGLLSSLAGAGGMIAGGI